MCRDSTRVSQSQRGAQQGPARPAPSIKWCLLNKINVKAKPLLIWLPAGNVQQPTTTCVLAGSPGHFAGCQRFEMCVTSLQVCVEWHGVLFAWKGAQNNSGGEVLLMAKGSWILKLYAASTYDKQWVKSSRFSAVKCECVFVCLLTGYQRQVSIGTGRKTSTSPSSFIASHQSHRSSSDYWPVTRVSRKLTVPFPVCWPPLAEMAPSTLVSIQHHRRTLSFSSRKVTSLQV